MLTGKVRGAPIAPKRELLRGASPTSHSIPTQFLKALSSPTCTSPPLFLHFLALPLGRSRYVQPSLAAASIPPTASVRLRFGEIRAELVTNGASGSAAAEQHLHWVFSHLPMRYIVYGPLEKLHLRENPSWCFQQLEKSD